MLETLLENIDLMLSIKQNYLLGNIRLRKMKFKIYFSCENFKTVSKFYRWIYFFIITTPRNAIGKTEPFFLFRYVMNYMYTNTVPIKKDAWIGIFALNENICGLSKCLSQALKVGSVWVRDPTHTYTNKFRFRFFV